MLSRIKIIMRHNFLLSGIKLLGVVLSISLVFASCTNDDVVQNPTKSREETNKNLTTFVAGVDTKTRTSLDYESGNFFWEAGDHIYVKDDDGILQKSTNAPTEKAASFKFMVPGKFAAQKSYNVYYLGQNGNDNSVTIPTNQLQTIPGNTGHLGSYGDYGTAIAKKGTDPNQFEMEVVHQPTILVFQPYTSNSVLKKCYLTKIEIISDNDIAETYTINPTTGALDVSPVEDGNKIVLSTKAKGSWKDKGFQLTNDAPSLSTNGVYVVIKPGTHALKVRYWVKDLVTWNEGAITKTYPSTEYASNTFYDMAVDLDVKIYDGDKYYMWDAQEQYWKGYEWDKGGSQPILNYLGLPSTPTSNDYAKNNKDARFYNESFKSDKNNPAKYSCAGLPNANELSWYCVYGDPRWDSDELWATMGHLYKGGTWFKKKSVLQKEGNYNTEVSADGVTDLRITPKADYRSNSIDVSGTSFAAEADNYFFVPALGYYFNGRLNKVGDEFDSWSSTASSSDRNSAYYLRFFKGYVYVNYYWNRYYGMRADNFFK